MNKQALYYAFVTSVVGLVISTLFMYQSEKKWPSWPLQAKVALSLYLTGLVSFYIVNHNSNSF